jgi:hypothetical protein
MGPVGKNCKILKAQSRRPRRLELEDAYAQHPEENRAAEQAYPPAEPLVVILDLRLSDKVMGMSLNGVPVGDFCRTPTEGKPGEGFTNRGVVAAKEYVRSHPGMRQDYLCVNVHRYYERDKKPEPVPEPVLAQPTVKPKQPLSSPSPKPQPPRMMTIKEIEGQYEDRRHWMS